MQWLLVTALTFQLVNGKELLGRCTERAAMKESEVDKARKPKVSVVLKTQRYKDSKRDTKKDERF